MSTLQELQAAQQAIAAQRQALALQVAEHAKPIFEAAQAALASPDVASLIETFAGLRDQLLVDNGNPNDVRLQLDNVIIVLTSVPSVIAAELRRVAVLLTPAEPPPDGGNPE